MAENSMLTLIKFTDGSGLLVRENPEEIDNMEEQSENGRLILSLQDESKVRVNLNNAITYFRVEPPKEDDVVVEEFEKGGVITLRSGLEQMSVRFKTDEDLIRNVLIFFTEETLEKALLARKNA